MATKMFRENVTIRWSEDVHEKPEPGRTYGKRIGRVTKEAVVAVEIDVEALARTLGRRAIHSKGGKAVECSGLVVIKRTGAEKVVASQPLE